MRYVLAGVSLVVALVLFGLGIGQRTLWAPPTSVTEQIDTTVTTPVLVLDGSFLHLHEGAQSIRAEDSGSITAVVGRTTDVLGWIDPGAYTLVSASGDPDAPIEVTVVDGESTVPDIAGSDLWVEEVTGEDLVSFVRNLPADHSVVFVTDGEAAAPSTVEVRWPISSSTPLFGPLMTAGLAMLALATLLFLFALRASKKKRGPQRRPNQIERSKRAGRRATKSLPPAEPAAIGATATATLAPAETQAVEGSELDDEVIDAELVESDDETLEDETAGQSDADGRDGADDDDNSDDSDDGDAQAQHDVRADTSDADDAGVGSRDDSGRAERTAAVTRPRRVRWARPTRGLRIIALPLLVGLALSACSAEYWPQDDAETAEATPAATDEPETFEETLPAPAVTPRQFERVLDDTRDVLAEAEAALSADIASARIGGDLLLALQANYQARGVNAAIPANVQIPDGSVELLLPQQTDVWPRQVLAIVGWQDSSQVQWALGFQQESARDNYQLVTIVQLIPQTTVPEVAGVEVGAASLPPTSPLLAFAPQDLAAAYGDVVLQGEASESAEEFSSLEDPLLTQIGNAAKAALQSDPNNALITISWTQTQAESPAVILSTTDGGALVMTSFTETTTAIPNTAGATVGPSGAVGIALLGAERSDTGIATKRVYELLMYVPAAGTDGQVEVLGFWDAVLSVSKL